MTAVDGAPLSLHVDAGALAGLARAWREAPELVAEEMTTALTEGSLLLEREVRERTPIGVGGGGGLAGSISAREPRISGDGVIGEVSTGLAHAVPVEFGRRPGQRQPPIDPLRDWAEAKLGVPPEESRGVAWAIARKIAVHGTEGAHMFREGADATRGEIERIFERGMDRISRRLAEARR